MALGHGKFDGCSNFAPFMCDAFDQFSRTGPLSNIKFHSIDEKVVTLKEKKLQQLKAHAHTQKRKILMPKSIRWSCEKGASLCFDRWLFSNDITLF